MTMQPNPANGDFRGIEVSPAILYTLTRKRNGSERSNIIHGIPTGRMSSDLCRKPPVHVHDMAYSEVITGFDVSKVVAGPSAVVHDGLAPALCRTIPSRTDVSMINIAIVGGSSVPHPA